MFGANRYVVDSSTDPESKLQKQCTALSYHKVREAISARYIKFEHIPGDRNLADILSKHWGIMMFGLSYIYSYSGQVIQQT
jgi:hypothetical protein